MDNQTDIVTQLENEPWYQSSSGPKVSSTVKGLAGLIIPFLQSTGLIKTGVTWLDSVIDILCIVGFGGYALYGYLHAKTVLGSRISTLQSQVKQLGQVPKA